MSARDNAAVAAVFAEMGDLLLIQGGDPYRARAFSRTAQVLATLREPLQELVSHGRLDRMPGIGSGSVERIKHILVSGTCADHQRLLQRVPPGLRDVLKVRGMGPRTTRLVLENLRVTDLASLEAAARSGALSRIQGIGPTTTQRVLAHLDELARGPGRRLLLSEALAIGDRIVAWLKDDPACTDALQTGSARRRHDVIGDLDFVAGARDAPAVARRFTQMPDVTEVLSGGDGFCIVLLSIAEGVVQADLRIVEPECFGAGVHHFTGNKQHNIALRLRANRLGLHLSEKGVWERKLRGKGKGDTNRKIARRITSGRTEEEVFAAVGLPFIPVELRTGDGEIDAAEAGRLPVLVDAPDLQGDLHVEPADAAAVSAMAHAARVRGLSWLGVVIDHERLATPDGQAMVRAMRAFEARPGSALTFFVAARARVGLDGAVALSPAAARWAQLVVAQPPVDPGGADVTDAVVRAVSSGLVDVLCRPTLRALPDDLRPRTDVWRVLRACQAAGVSVEVGGDPRTLDLDAAGCKAAVEIGTRLALTSCAATPEALADVRYALWQARRGAVSKQLVDSTLDAPALAKRWQARGRAAASTPSSLSDAVRDPLVEALQRAPDDALRLRLERYLRGEADPDLERALLVEHGAPLQAAFEILTRVRA